MISHALPGLSRTTFPIMHLPGLIIPNTIHLITHKHTHTHAYKPVPQTTPV